MKIRQLSSKSDIVGALASGFCLVHCLATPILFIAQAKWVGHSLAHPQWWGLLDLVFLGISFAAVWWSVKATSKKWMRVALWLSWVVLALIVFNERFSWFQLMEEAIYIPTAALIFLHLYNRKYCHLSREQWLGDV